MKSDSGKAVAVIESVLANGRKALRQKHRGGGEVFALGKGVVAYSLQAVGELQVTDVVVVESLLADGGQCGGELHSGEYLIIIECIRTYLGDVCPAQVDGLELLAAVEHGAGDERQSVGQLDGLQFFQRREMGLARECSRYRNKRRHNCRAR